MSGKTITRADLCEAVYQKVGLSRTESAALVELVLLEWKFTESYRLRAPNPAKDAERF